VNSAGERWITPPVPVPPPPRPRARHRHSCAECEGSWLTVLLALLAVVCGVMAGTCWLIVRVGA